MKWRHPEIGATRIIQSEFLWWPKRIGDETRWLEKATWVDDYIYAYRFWKSRIWIDNKDEVTL